VEICTKLKLCQQYIINFYNSLCLKGFLVFSEGLAVFTLRSVYSDGSFHVTICYPGRKKKDWMDMWFKPRNLNVLRGGIDD